MQTGFRKAADEMANHQDDTVDWKINDRACEALATRNDNKIARFNLRSFRRYVCRTLILPTSTDRLDAKRRETFHLRYVDRLIAHAHVNRHYRISMLPEDEEVVDDYFV